MSTLSSSSLSLSLVPLSLSPLSHIKITMKSFKKPIERERDFNERERLFSVPRCSERATSESYE
jgi:hypothetical protein